MKDDEKKKESQQATVTKLADRKSQKERNETEDDTAEKTKPPKVAEVYLALADAVNRSITSCLPRFPETFYVVEDVRGVRRVATPRADGSLEAVIPEAVVHVLMDYTATTLASRREYALTHRAAVEAVSTWIAATAPLVDIPHTRWLSEPGHCWRRLPFDLIPNDGAVSLTPTWNDLLGRIEDRDASEAFKAWIGSLFAPGSYRQQYVWMYSAGGNGKGAITRFLHKVFGAGAHFLSNIPREPNQFWTSQLIGRRLVVVPDCDNAKFPSSGLFKTISGDDPITIEPKGKPAYTDTLDCKFMFTSNARPELTSMGADMRRAIYVELGGGATWEADFEERLWSEGGAFLWGCIEAYRGLCADHRPIPVGENEALTTLVSSLEEPQAVAFAKWFEKLDGAFVVPSDMGRVAEIEWPGRQGMYSKFKTWMERTHGVRIKRPRLPCGERPYRYVGIRLKRSLAGTFSSFVDRDD